MDNFLTFTSQPAAILFFRLFGTCLVLVGAFSALLDVKALGAIPTDWILLGLASFMGAMCNTLFAIRRDIEAKGPTKV